MLHGPIERVRRFMLALCVLCALLPVFAEGQAPRKTYTNEKFCYTISYPATWFPSGTNYANAFEVRSYDAKHPESVAERNRASVLITDTVNDDTAATDRFLDSMRLQAGKSGFLLIDGHRAVRVERKEPARQVSGGVSAISGPPGSTQLPILYYDISIYIADEKHVISMEGSATAQADSTMVNQINEIENSVTFAEPHNTKATKQKGGDGL
jgi:hypothetical protein